jgi:hypothetical protein
LYLSQSGDGEIELTELYQALSTIPGTKLNKKSLARLRTQVGVQRLFHKLPFA